ncbi:MAG: helix-turn-helix domain-containing protein [Candidatus Poribacteria bacterium]|nr:helix-turn-helix domain-containing protein [Candidatus Poribacteria bacterium]
MAIVRYKRDQIPQDELTVEDRTDEEIIAAAESDPDNPPLTDEDLARMPEPPFVRRLRNSLYLTQKGFAEMYQIPLSTLREWEQGRRSPDQAAQTYLKLISRAPELVRRVLNEH